MLSSILRSSSVIWTLGFVFRFCLASQPVCLAGIYGVPNYRDCMSAWLSMPFARDPSGRSNPESYELLSEPQYLLPPFTPIHNRYKPLPINQLPKIWRSSTLISTPPSNSVIQCSGAPLLLSVDERVSRHLPSRTDEYWPTPTLSSVCTMERKLGLHLEPDADAFCLWQPSKWDKSKWRIHGFDQYVDSLCVRVSSVSHAHIWLTPRCQTLQAQRPERWWQLCMFTRPTRHLRIWSTVT